MNRTHPHDVVIVGAGPAGHMTAVTLRELGFGGRVTIVTEEGLRPYDRTSVSKSLIGGATAPTPLEPSEIYEGDRLELRLNARAVALDVDLRRVTLSSGESLGYDALVVCTGASPVIPPQWRMPRVHTMRSAEDAMRLAVDMSRGGSLAIVGFGFIGAEVASAARSVGIDVHAVDALAVPFSDRFGDQAGRFLTSMHQEAGVRLHLGARVAGIVPEGDQLFLRLPDGGIRVDAAVVGVGSRPDVDWLAKAGADTGDGVLTDSNGRTSLPGVFAGGDCARWYSVRQGRHVRIEHWDTALLHGRHLAAAVLGSEAPFDPLPVFWSEQHGSRVQWVGHARATERVEIEKSVEDGKFVARFYAAGALHGLLAVNEPRAISRARRELRALDERQAAS